MTLSPWQSVDDVLAYAIQIERDALNIYMAAANLVADPAIADLLHAFAKQEKAHAVRLEELRGARRFELTTGDLAALHSQVNPDLPDVPRDTLEDILRYAIQAEVDIQALYTTLAGMTNNPDVSVMFQALAQDERDHAIWFKEEYARQTHG